MVLKKKQRRYKRIILCYNEFISHHSKWTSSKCNRFIIHSIVSQLELLCSSIKMLSYYKIKSLIKRDYFCIRFRHYIIVHITYIMLTINYIVYPMNFCVLYQFIIRKQNAWNVKNDIANGKLIKVIYMPFDMCVIFKYVWAHCIQVGRNKLFFNKHKLTCRTWKS